MTSRIGGEGVLYLMNHVSKTINSSQPTPSPRALSVSMVHWVSWRGHQDKDEWSKGHRRCWQGWEQFSFYCFWHGQSGNKILVSCGLKWSHLAQCHESCWSEMPHVHRAQQKQPNSSPGLFCFVEVGVGCVWSVKVIRSTSAGILPDRDIVYFDIEEMTFFLML